MIPMEGASVVDTRQDASPDANQETGGGQRSPLAGVFPAGDGAAQRGGADVSVEALPAAGQVAVRGKPGDTAFLTAASSVLGADLPLVAGGVAAGGNHTVIWLGPDHWLVVCEAGGGPALTGRLEAAFEGLFAAAVDVSGARTGLRVSGPAAADLLATGCRLDLDPAVFGPGQSMQTPLGNVTAIIHCVALEPPAYEIYVPRSTAVSFWCWLEHAGWEFGLQSVTAG